MSKNMLKIIIIAALLGLFAGSVCGESLWPSDIAPTMLADKKASKIGDILTILIVESATASQKASTDASKSSSLKSKAGIGPLLKNLPPFEFSGGDSMTADGSTSRSNNFIAKITVKVINVDKYGNLEIEGKRYVQTNKEKAEMKLTGSIRPQDVETDNTVLSTFIADAKITYEGTGPVGSRQKEGFISKLFKILF